MGINGTDNQDRNSNRKTNLSKLKHRPLRQVAACIGRYDKNEVCWQVTAGTGRYNTNDINSITDVVEIL